MEEIEVGEYVRIKDGRIIKFNKFGTFRVGCREPIYYKTIVSGRSHYKFDTIIKHSKNIIDLIEEGDYVNGSKVVGKDNNCILILTDGGQTCYRNIFENKDIKSILTKEQYDANCYRLEE